MFRIITKKREKKLAKREASVREAERNNALLFMQLTQEKVALERARTVMDANFENWAGRIIASELGDTKRG